jgi:parallel beta-helix repeat protein
VDNSGGADFTKIQDAVNAASGGDTIIVRSGTYTEDVRVNKSLILKGINHPTIKPPEHSYAFGISADECTIEGFYITGAEGGFYISSNDNIISNNRIIGPGPSIPFHGVILSTVGICIDFGSANDVSGNMIENCYIGIDISYSDDNHLMRNAVNSCGLGIYFWKVRHTILRENIMSANRQNFVISSSGTLSGGEISYFIQDIDTSNTVDGKPIYYLVNDNDRVIDSGTNAGYVAVINSDNVIVRDLTLTNNSEGVLFAGTKNSRIENVHVQDNMYGIKLACSSNHNTLVGNTASSSDVFGIALYDSFSNALIDNVADSSDDAGIELINCVDNTLTNNTVNLNAVGVDLRNSNAVKIINNDLSLITICMVYGWLTHLTI